MFRTPLNNQSVGSALSIAMLVIVSTANVDAGEWKMIQQSASFMGTKWHIAFNNICILSDCYRPGQRHYSPDQFSDFDRAGFGDRPGCHFSNY